jgi:hypothetical protein
MEDSRVSSGDGYAIHIKERRFENGLDETEILGG